MSFHDLARLSHVGVAAIAARDGSIAIVQTGALEAHGPHLPIGNDTIYIERLCQAVAERMAVDVVTCPTIVGGMSHRHRRFPGTVVLSSDALKSSILSAVSTFSRAGFRKIALVSGHGGNFPPMREAYHAAQGLFPASVVRAYGGFGRSFSQPLAELAAEIGFPIGPSEGHAGLFQTAIALHLFPELVSGHENVVGFVDDDPNCWKVLAVQGSHAVHPTGVIGNPSRATAELGRLGFERLVERFHEWLETAFDRPDDWRYRARDAATFDYLDPEDFTVTPEPSAGAQGTASPSASS